MKKSDKPNGSNKPKSEGQIAIQALMAHYTVTSLAEKLGTHRVTVSRWKSGAKEIPLSRTKALQQLLAIKNL